MTMDITLRALNDVISENRSIRSIAEKHGLKMPVRKKARQHGLENFQFGNNNNNRQIISDAQELQLKDYILKLHTSILAFHRKKSAIWLMNVPSVFKLEYPKCGRETNPQAPTGSHVL